MYRRIALTLLVAAGTLTASSQQATSPDGRLQATIHNQGMVISYDKQQVLELPTLGYESASLPTPLTFRRTLSESYVMKSGKRLQCSSVAQEYLSDLGPGLKMVVRLFNDGIALRYEFTDLHQTTLPQELTTWRIPEGTRRWMQNWTDSYEEYFPLSTTYKTPPRVPRYEKSAEGYACSWGYPALLQPADNLFALISESNIERRQSASCLRNEGELFRVAPDNNRQLLSGPWHSPWRIAIIGNLATIVESTLVTDLAEPCLLTNTEWIRPGVVSWVYWAYNHGSNDYNIICKYVDMAATLNLPYVLIDAEWDQMKDGKTIEDAVSYALAKGVKPMIWYNSSVGWIDGAPTPKFRLNKAEDREREFAWCEKIGVAGVKIDFFSGDDQHNMDYCLDLIQSTARHHLLVNFHGATIPRGWQRTFPNLLSTEGVLGAEWYNNNGTLTNKAAAHNATLPFTRNVIGPMDYTPCAFSDSQHPHITSNAHELALTVVFESGLQHLADKPESFLAQPQEVQTFLSQLPAVWDETRFVCGYPGEDVVLARRSGNTWYVGGLNGTDQTKTIKLNIPFIKGRQVTTFADSNQKTWQITTTHKLPTEISCQPRGGFVLVIK